MELKYSGSEFRILIGLGGTGFLGLEFRVQELKIGFGFKA